MVDRITKEEAVTFLLTYIVVEKRFALQLDALALFQIMNIAAQGTQAINSTDGVTPHEVLEALADEFIAARPPA